MGRFRFLLTVHRKNTLSQIVVDKESASAYTGVGVTHALYL